MEGCHWITSAAQVKEMWMNYFKSTGNGRMPLDYFSRTGDGNVKLLEIAPVIQGCDKISLKDRWWRDAIGFLQQHRWWRDAVGLLKAQVIERCDWITWKSTNDRGMQLNIFKGLVMEGCGWITSKSQKVKDAIGFLQKHRWWRDAIGFLQKHRWWRDVIGLL